jgi:hypothetical protein
MDERESGQSRLTILNALKKTTADAPNFRWTCFVVLPGLHNQSQGASRTGATIASKTKKNKRHENREGISVRQVWMWAQKNRRAGTDDSRKTGSNSPELDEFLLMGEGHLTKGKRFSEVAVKADEDN